VGGACGTRGRGEKLYNVLVGNPEGKRTLGRPKEDEFGMDLTETGRGLVIVCFTYFNIQ
jgi:hypothetical protein